MGILPALEALESWKIIDSPGKTSPASMLKVASSKGWCLGDRQSIMWWWTWVNLPFKAVTVWGIYIYNIIYIYIYLCRERERDSLAIEQFAMGIGTVIDGLPIKNGDKGIQWLSLIYIYIILYIYILYYIYIYTRSKAWIAWYDMPRLADRHLPTQLYTYSGCYILFCIRYIMIRHTFFDYTYRLENQWTWPWWEVKS